MNRISRFLALLLLTGAAALPARAQVTAELDRYWAEVSRTVTEGDFDGYAATYHPDAVLVSLGSRTSYPISQALAGWKNGFDQTRAGRMKAGVEFRFTRRLNDAATAHDAGMFRYFSQETGAQPQVVLLHFESLLVKKNGVWKMMMEFQKEPATEAEWEAAASGVDSRALGR